MVGNRAGLCRGWTWSQDQTQHQHCQQHFGNLSQDRKGKCQRQIDDFSVTSSIRGDSLRLYVDTVYTLLLYVSLMLKTTFLDVGLLQANFEAETEIVLDWCLHQQRGCLCVPKLACKETPVYKVEFIMVLCLSYRCKFVIIVCPFLMELNVTAETICPCLCFHLVQNL